MPEARCLGCGYGEGIGITNEEYEWHLNHCTEGKDLQNRVEEVAAKICGNLTPGEINLLLHLIYRNDQCKLAKEVVKVYAMIYPEEAEPFMMPEFEEE